MNADRRLVRLPDWPERLAAHIESRRRAPFAWGSNDCVLHAADGVLAMTAVDLAAGNRRYKTQIGAMRILRPIGGLQALVAEYLQQHDTARLSQRGDVVVVALEGRDTLGLVVGNGTWCAPGARGLVFRPMSEVQLAFAV